MNIVDELGEISPEMLLADGFEDALLGYIERCGMSPIALYSTKKCIDILIERDGMSEEDAYEFFYYNVAGAYVGEYTPCFATILTDGEVI